MVALAMADKDGCRAVESLGLTALGECGVAGETGINEEALLVDLEAKAGMSEPCDFRYSLPMICSGSG